MRFLLQSILSLCLLLGTSAADNDHPSLRRGLQGVIIPKFPYARLVSHVEKGNGKDWCLVPKNTDDLGIVPCSTALITPDRELFLMDIEGKIRNKLDNTKCLAVGNGYDAVRGGARIKFISCLANVDFITFEHDRSSSAMIRVKEAPTYCLTQTGNSAQTTDTIRTELCDTSNPGFIFDYDDFGCDETLFDDVGCCDDTACPGLGRACVDYACIVNPAPEPIPAGYKFFVSQVSAEEAWCITQKEGTENGKDLGILPCDFVNQPDAQLFRLENGKIRNLADPTQCLTVKTGGNLFTQGAISGGDRIQFLDCDSPALFTFAHDEGLGTDTISVVEDPTYCFKQTGNSAQTSDTIRAEPCDTGKPGLQFEFVDPIL